MGKVVILRHDVDKSSQNSLNTAILENRLGIKGTYYFRIGKSSNNPSIIRAIASLGHEIGYHYEDLVLANGNLNKAILYFQNNLEYFRRYYPIKTICMHGSPMSKWDNRTIWSAINYKDYGLIGEPYFDLNFDQFSYLTDTGRMWNAKKGNRRDKVVSQKLDFKTTFDVVDGIDQLPDRMMITTHPQRWTNNIFSWATELILQNSKNIVKGVICIPQQAIGVIEKRERYVI